MGNSTRNRYAFRYLWYAWDKDRSKANVYDLHLGENLNGAKLSFTTHSKSCQWDRKDRIYELQVDASDPHERMSERAFIALNLPYYNSTLFMCLTPSGSNEVFHQGDRYEREKVARIQLALPFFFSPFKAGIEDSSDTSSIADLDDDHLFSMSSRLVGSLLRVESWFNVIDSS